MTEDRWSRLTHDMMVGVLDLDYFRCSEYVDGGLWRDGHLFS